METVLVKFDRLDSKYQPIFIGVDNCNDRFIIKNVSIIAFPGTEIFKKSLLNAVSNFPMTYLGEWSQGSPVGKRVELKWEDI